MNITHDQAGSEKSVEAVREYDYKPNVTRVMPKESSIRPIHYGGAGAQYEVFNVLEAWGLDKDFYLGNVIKYVEIGRAHV